MSTFIPPAYKESAFHCPHCHVFAKQTWIDVKKHEYYNSAEYVGDMSKCSHCDGYAFWYKEKMIDPLVAMGEIPIPEMPENIKDDMNEARSIIAQSPRGAAALLRLCLQNLCKELLKDRSKSINADIALLVKEEGLSPRIQKAMDGIRVTGNEAVHPGELDLRDDTDTSVFMCQLLNKICYELIVRPKEEDDFYAKLPESKREGIEIRDKQAPKVVTKKS